MNMFNFSPFLLKPTHSDFIIKVNEEKFYTHKIILAARSSYFQLLFASETEKFSELCVENVSSEAVRSVLRYIYTGDSVLDKNAFLDGLILAHQYSLKDLQTTLTKNMESTINMNNIATVLNTANLHHMSQLKKICYNFIRKHLTEILATDFFNSLSEQSLSDIVKNFFNSKPKNEEILLKTKVMSCLESVRQNVSQVNNKLEIYDEPDGQYIGTTKRRLSSTSDSGALVTRSKAKAQKIKKQKKRKCSKLIKESKTKQKKSTKDHTDVKTTTEKKPFRISDSKREKKIGIAVTNFNELLHKVREKFELKDVVIVLEEDGTEITDEEYFTTLEANTNLMVLEKSQKWVPLNCRQKLDVDVVDHPGSSENSELRELIEKLQSNISHVSLLGSAKLELLADMDSVHFPFFDGTFLENLKEVAGRYLSEKREAQEAMEFLKLYQESAQSLVH